MILEGIVTTLGPQDAANIAAMGPTVPDDADRFERFILRPFETSQTYANLRRSGQGVLHVTDDVLLLAEATVGQPQPPLLPARFVRGQRLADCCRLYEFQVEEWQEDRGRARLSARVVYEERVRDFFGFNRGKHAVVEAAILASRVFLIPRPEIQAEFDRLRILVEKTGGPKERLAFQLLEGYVRASASDPGS